MRNYLGDSLYDATKAQRGYGNSSTAAVFAKMVSMQKLKNNVLCTLLIATIMRTIVRRMLRSSKNHKNNRDSGTTDELFDFGFAHHAVCRQPHCDQQVQKPDQHHPHKLYMLCIAQYDQPGFSLITVIDETLHKSSEQFRQLSPWIQIS